ncbi:hypothetical protein NVP1275O_22 [Vibrio phage 1.275.O._10N.286.54.E11]|nr:hypothetical protein NVP1275O_22 [Vibrio phage 1.275.O._10N.286.54.E11]
MIFILTYDFHIVRFGHVQRNEKTIMATRKVQSVTQIPPFTPTKEQRKWIENKKKKTGDSFASILRGLMQKEIDND